MTLKGWMLGKTNDTSKRNARLRTPTAVGGAAGVDPREPSFNAFGQRGAAADEPVHLGPYAPLIGAIREELEQFVANQLRLHLAIAERDRYVLTSIEVECEGGEAERELLRRFVREFRPEQIKHYVAKEIIAGLRNASAIDLSQFAGLNAERDEAGASRDEERYGDLIAELASGAPRGVAHPYRVTLVGRWSELAAPAADERAAAREGPRTPLAARPIGVDIEDGGGARRIDLSVVPGRRYTVGKGEGCDIVVDGVYASRRHCELWFDKGTWWVADAGSTNGIRVESADGATTRDQGDARAAARQPPIELAPGAWVVLAAHMRGEPKQYPRVSLRAVEAPAEAKPANAAKQTALATPVTPIAPPRKRARGWTITARMASGARTIELGVDALPYRVGRSRNQALVIDWAHADVSGRHFEIVALDAAGAKVVVHGDNGVTVEGSSHGPGAEFIWKNGETLRLGASGAASPCELTLACED
jgi:pSer/pThr/pTyr-binding forkhead associated (FHA) protein